MTQLSIKKISSHQVLPNDGPSQKELVEELMALIILLQHMQGILNNDTLGDMARITKQSQSMSDLAHVEYTNTCNAANELLHKLEELENRSWWQKLLGDICGAISILMGALMVATGNPLGGVLIATGAMALAENISPGVMDKMISGICGDDPFLKLMLKIFIVAISTAAASLAGGPAGALIMFGTTFSTFNITKEIDALIIMKRDGLDAKKAEEKADQDSAVWITNLVVSTVAAVASMFVGFSAASGAVQGSSFYEKAQKVLEFALPSLLAAANISESSLGIDIGIKNIQLSEIMKTIAKAKAGSLSTQQQQEMLDTIVKFAQGFLHSLLQTFESTNRTTNNIFIDQKKFAEMYAKVV